MKQQPVALRRMARRDIEDAIDHYRTVGDATVAGRFVTMLDAALRNISRRPKMGSPTFGYELDIPGLRSRRLAVYPYVVFYIEREALIDVWRVLHTRRDLPHALTGSQR